MLGMGLPLEVLRLRISYVNLTDSVIPAKERHAGENRAGICRVDIIKTQSGYGVRWQSAGQRSHAATALWPHGRRGSGRPFLQPI